MQLRDLPYYHHFSDKEKKARQSMGMETPLAPGEKPHIILKGNNEILRKKFGKYIKKK